MAMAALAADCDYDALPQRAVDVVTAGTVGALTMLATGRWTSGTAALRRGARRALGPRSSLAASPLTAAFTAASAVEARGGAPLLADCGVPLGALAVGALAGSANLGRIPGRELVASVAAGAEAQARLSASVPTGGRAALRWLPETLLSYFGHALVASRLRKLGPDGHASALGIAVTLASGSQQSLRAGQQISATSAGLAALGGTWAALQAAAGVDGRFSALTGPWGLFGLWFESSPAETLRSEPRHFEHLDALAQRPSIEATLAAYEEPIRTLVRELVAPPIRATLSVPTEAWCELQTLAPAERARLEAPLIAALLPPAASSRRNPSPSLIWQAVLRPDAAAASLEVEGSATRSVPVVVLKPEEPRTFCEAAHDLLLQDPALSDALTEMGLWSGGIAALDDVAPLRALILRALDPEDSPIRR